MKRKYADIIRRHAQAKSDEDDESPSYTDEEDEPPPKTRRRAPSSDLQWPSQKAGASNCRSPTACGCRRSSLVGPLGRTHRRAARLRLAPRAPRRPAPPPLGTPAHPSRKGRPSWQCSAAVSGALP